MDTEQFLSDSNIPTQHYNGTDYTLAAVLLGLPRSKGQEAFPGAVNFWCQKNCDKRIPVWNEHAAVAREDSWIHNPFYPYWTELRAIVWTKLSRPSVLETILKIWNDSTPDFGGVRGVSKFVAVLCTRSCIDYKRKQETRYRNNPSDVFSSGWDLSDPVTLSEASDGVNEDIGTVGDTISDESAEGLQSFSLTDLQDLMTEEEYEILWAAFADDKSVREISDETGLTKSSVDRRIQKAKQKAEKWLTWLKNEATPEQARAYMTPVMVSRGAHTITQSDTKALGAGNKATQAFVEEYRRLEIVNQIKQFSSAKTVRLLLKLHEHSDAIGIPRTPLGRAIAMALVAKASGEPEKFNKAMRDVEVAKLQITASKEITLPANDSDLPVVPLAADFFKTQIVRENLSTQEMIHA